MTRQGRYDMDMENAQKTERLFGAILGDVDLARRVTDYLAGCTGIPSKENLMNFRGIGESTAEKIIACCELSARYVVGTEARSVINPEDAMPYLCWMKFEPQEHFVVLTLDSANHVIGKHDVTVGLVNQTPIAPREVFRAALLDNAVSIMVAHNHPSGSTEPSEQDWAITRMICAAGKIMKISVVDHIVVGKCGYTSMCREDPCIFESSMSK